MEHGKKNRKFGRETKQRQALMESLANSLIEHGKIITTQAKAKSLKTYIDKLVTKSKNANLGNRKLLSARLGNKSAKKLIKEVSTRFMDRNGGYTRVISLNNRVSDNAKMSLIEFV